MIHFASEQRLPLLHAQLLLLLLLIAMTRMMQQHMELPLEFEPLMKG